MLLNKNETTTIFNLSTKRDLELYKFYDLTKYEEKYCVENFKEMYKILKDFHKILKAH